jgi:hypothetical protein
MSVIIEPAVCLRLPLRRYPVLGTNHGFVPYFGCSQWSSRSETRVPKAGHVQQHLCQGRLRVARCRRKFLGSQQGFWLVDQYAPHISGLETLMHDLAHFHCDAYHYYVNAPYAVMMPQKSARLPARFRDTALGRFSDFPHGYTVPKTTSVCTPGVFSFSDAADVSQVAIPRLR